MIDRNKIDLNKRNALKAIGVTGASAMTGLTAPMVFAGRQSGIDGELQKNSPFSGITITHYDNFQGHTVLLRNSTDRAVTLRNFSPGAVTTPAGEFNLNVLIDSGELTVPANSTQAVSITREGKAARYALWKHIENAEVESPGEAGSQYVSVVGQYESLNLINASRIHSAKVVIT